MKRVFSRLTKNILIVISGIIATLIIYFVATITFYGLTHPTISFKDFNKPMDYTIISAEQIESYLMNEIRQIDKLAKYDLTLGSIDMKINDGHRGEVTAIFVEKDSENSKVIFAYLNTNNSIFYKFSDYGRESKLNPGVIHLSEWKIDSTDAIRISEDFFSDNKDFRYDEIWIKSCSYYKWNEETWDVYLTDRKNNIRYGTRINPYSGEVLVDTIEH